MPIIVPNRTMRLGGARVETGKPVEVPQADAELAIRHGWAVEGKGKKAKAKDDAKPADEQQGGEG